MNPKLLAFSKLYILIGASIATFFLLFVFCALVITANQMLKRGNMVKICGRNTPTFDCKSRLRMTFRLARESLLFSITTFFVWPWILFLVVFSPTSFKMIHEVKAPR